MECNSLLVCRQQLSKCSYRYPNCIPLSSSSSGEQLQYSRWGLHGPCYHLKTQWTYCQRRQPIKQIQMHSHISYHLLCQSHMATSTIYDLRHHRCRLVENSGWANQNIGGQKVVKSDKCMGISQLLGGTCPGSPPKVYAYVWHVSSFFHWRTTITSYYV